MEPMNENVLKASLFFLFQQGLKSRDISLVPTDVSHLLAAILIGDRYPYPYIIYNRYRYLPILLLSQLQTSVFGPSV